jgi:hypothetical protein
MCSVFVAGWRQEAAVEARRAAERPLPCGAGRRTGWQLRGYQLALAQRNVRRNAAAQRQEEAAADEDLA